MIKLEEIIDKLGWWPDTVNGVEKEFKRVKKQVSDDYKKARKWDELALDEEDKDIALHGAKIIKQNLKLRELVEEEFQYYDITFKKHKDIDDFKIAQVLTNLLRKSKND